MTTSDTRSLALSKVPKGSFVVIAELPSGKVKSQFIRLGIFEGQSVRCIERLPGGTLILERNRQEIAIGGKLARHVLVHVKK